MNLRGLFAASAFAMLAVAPLSAQEPVAAPVVAENPTVLASDRVQSTPEMWFYQQSQERHDNPKLAVRRKAEYKAMQRQYRIAMMNAQGLSKMRPMVSATPMFGYLPTQDPYRWGFGRGEMQVNSPYRATIIR